ncbi:polysaccharide deacetylase family protein [Bacillus rubiinfantis]|uniref:polysaccharide deacetylase family protein n=1 Tax=Bacillus rubiinfantis TaxID=1499680 RepID=UPI00069490F5|nr:polysaccharide deacetylase family protein [Bacillus rubiinfantis]
MGKFKRGWSLGVLFLMIVAVGIFAGISVTHFLQAKAAVKTINLVKKESTIHPEKMITRPPELDRSFITLQSDKQQYPAFAWEDMKKIHTEGKKIATNKTYVRLAVKKHEVSHPVTNGRKTANSKTHQQDTVKKNAQVAYSKQSKGEWKKRRIYLTFDDGPSTVSHDIIAQLKKYHYKATFFMIDGNIRRYPEAVKLMVKSGEGVGLHSVSHDVNRFYSSVHTVITELQQNQQTLKEISGKESNLIRTPYGSSPHMKPEYREAVNKAGFKMWDWNIDSKDWYYKDNRYVTNVIEQLTRLQNHQEPIVILLHERKETLTHLPKLLAYLKKNGYESHSLNSDMVPVQF